MRPTRMFPFFAAILAVFSAAPAFSDTESGSGTTWDCPQTDGSSIYTNKERVGCHAMALKSLSVVPDLVNIADDSSTLNGCRTPLPDSFLPGSCFRHWRPECPRLGARLACEHSAAGRLGHKRKCVCSTWNGFTWCRKPVEECSLDPIRPMAVISQGVISVGQATRFTTIHATSRYRESLGRGSFP